MKADQDSFETAVAVRALAARHEVLSIAIKEALKLLTPEQASRCGESIRTRVKELSSLSLAAAMAQVDEAMAGELSAMLSALVR